ncbi:hypothetical protein [Bacteroides sp. OM08-17BH]|uniref:hypothetical protein n=1 Tax=Bacteroides sp. OM08-17BH TaxID=2292285 RepID=UPI000E4497A0|nr:hypothetical protein [Bacteroides sp. OM08-17BH]RGM26966.1 hypothetical protein DXC20_13240 [Bacteroides sp. OM08-17BH]
MIYNDLGKISLSRFIDIFLGDIDKVVQKGMYSAGEKVAAAERLCNEYISIIGGRSAVAQISRRNEVLKIQIRLNCLSICERMVSSGDWGDAVDILATLGYKFKEDEHEKIKSRITSVSASDRYRLAKLEDNTHDAGRVKMDREYFTRERVSLMSHIKMHIDENTFSAKEYAYMVRRMCDDVDAMIRSTSKRK